MRCSWERAIDARGAKGPCSLRARLCNFMRRNLVDPDWIQPEHEKTDARGRLRALLRECGRVLLGERILMPIVPASRILRHLRSAALRQAGGGLEDAQLLERFLAERDEAAFEALVRRHGPMVFGVCRRVLGGRHDAEDAFQATFLVLACKAAAVRDRGAVGSWLYGVAYRTAGKARARAARRRVQEREAAVSEARNDKHQHED